MTKLAAVFTDEALTKFNGKAFIVNLIHDEILIESEESIAQEVVAIVKECMERAGTYFMKTLSMVVEPSINKFWSK
jgi:DNA polymerase I-like protein with 3'-5' exonuclease and polymerase domains